LVEIWSELLRIEKPGIEDDFFRLGGHSLLATQLVSRVHEVFQVRLPLRSMFESPTIASMAERIALEYPHDEQQPSYLTTCESIIVPIQCNGSKTPIFIVPGGTGGDDVLMSYARMLRSLGPERPCFGFNARALCEEPFGCQSTEEIARHLMDEIRNLQPKGPYLLAGECAGGIAAFELAQQFRAQGEEVRLLVLMDTECPSASVPLRYRLPIIRHDLSERIGEYRRNLARLEPAQWGPFVLGKSKNGWSRIESALRLKGKQGGQARSQVRLDPQFADSKYLQILFHYRPQRYNGSITLMISEAVYPEGKVQAWAGLAAKGADVYVVPGDHTRYIRDNSQVFARILKSCIEKAEP
jgi:thioesterase domain-containing protein